MEWGLPMLSEEQVLPEGAWVAVALAVVEALVEAEVLAGVAVAAAP